MNEHLTNRSKITKELRGYTYKTSLNSVADGHVEFKMVFIIVKYISTSHMLSSLSLILFLYSENEYSKYLIN